MSELGPAGAALRSSRGSAAWRSGATEPLQAESAALAQDAHLLGADDFESGQHDDASASRDELECRKRRAGEALPDCRTRARRVLDFA